MALLINKAKVSELMQVAIGAVEAEYDKHIEEAQKFDLKPLLCDEFYFDLMKNKDEENYQLLINGGEYQYNGLTYAHEGIGSVLAYFSYARFFFTSSLVSTTHGAVIRTTPYSEPVSLEERKNIYYKKREEASALMADVIKFICRNRDLFPIWHQYNERYEKRKGSFSTRVI
jgi:hypothetical protein